MSVCSRSREVQNADACQCANFHRPWGYKGCMWIMRGNPEDWGDHEDPVENARGLEEYRRGGGLMCMSCGSCGGYDRYMLVRFRKSYNGDYYESEHWWDDEGEMWEWEESHREGEVSTEFASGCAEDSVRYMHSRKRHREPSLGRVHCVHWGWDPRSGQFVRGE